MKVAILGLGVVGSGVYNQLINHKEKIEKEANSKFEITCGLVKEITPEIEKKFDKIKLTTDVNEILEDNSVDCIIEVMGGIDHTYEILKKAFNSKKHVVSANKDLIAVHGVELLELAKQNNCDFYFEASVAGGIPILRSIFKGLASDYIYDIKGILNGTSNYILTKMSKENLSYEDALKQAQDLGFAEADPTADVAGHDAARKVAILAMLSYHIDTKFSDVACIGIEDVSSADIMLAHELGYEIKLIGHSHYEAGKVSLSVVPSFVSLNHQLASVNNEMNAVYVSGEAIGNVLLYGPGAGSNPTGTAVMSDVLEVARNMNSNCSGRDIILPYNDKRVDNETVVERYIIISETVKFEEIISPLDYGEGYLIADLSKKHVDELVEKYNCKAYPILNN